MANQLSVEKHGAHPADIFGVRTSSGVFEELTERDRKDPLMSLDPKNVARVDLALCPSLPRIIVNAGGWLQDTLKPIFGRWLTRRLAAAAPGMQYPAWKILREDTIVVHVREAAQRPSPLTRQVCFLCAPEGYDARTSLELLVVLFSVSRYPNHRTKAHNAQLYGAMKAVACAGKLPVGFFMMVDSQALAPTRAPRSRELIEYDGKEIAQAAEFLTRMRCFSPALRDQSADRWRCCEVIIPFTAFRDEIASGTAPDWLDQVARSYNARLLAEVHAPPRGNFPW